MPYKNPEDKLRRMAEWRKRKMAEGYGKALYARRKQRYENEEKLREAVLNILDMAASWSRPMEDSERLAIIIEIGTTALKEAPEVEKPINYMPEKGGE